MPSYLVTGASRGIGYGLIQTLASDPTNTVIGLVRDLGLTTERLAQDKITNIHLVAADITDPAALREAALATEQILQQAGHAGLDVLINNAAYMSGATALTTLQDHKDDIQTLGTEMQKSLDINMFAVIETVYAFLSLVQRSIMKKVIAISSGQCDINFINETRLPFTVPYAVSKAALNVVFAKFQAAYADHGILFTSICPGMVDTDGLHVLSESELAAERGQIIAERMTKYAGGIPTVLTPIEAATSILRIVSESSIEGGHGGSFRSHNGTNRYL